MRGSLTNSSSNMARLSISALLVLLAAALPRGTEAMKLGPMVEQQYITARGHWEFIAKFCFNADPRAGITVGKVRGRGLSLCNRCWCRLVSVSLFSLCLCVSSPRLRLHVSHCSLLCVLCVLCSLSVALSTLCSPSSVSSRGTRPLLSPPSALRAGRRLDLRRA